MKFSSALQFNAVPDWAQHYIDYSGLKKNLYIIERDIIAKNPQQQHQHQHQHQQGQGGRAHTLTDECSTLLAPQSLAHAAFVPLLDKELAKIESFYRKKEEELFAKAGEVEASADMLGSTSTLSRRRSTGFFRKFSAIQPDGANDASPAASEIPIAEHPIRGSHSLQAPLLSDHSGIEFAAGPGPTGGGGPSSTADDGQAHGFVDSMVPENVTNAYIPVDHHEDNSNNNNNNTRTQSFSTANGGDSDGDDEGSICGECGTGAAARGSLDAQGHSRRRTTSMDYRRPNRMGLRDQARNIFILLYDLRSYAQLNYTGFSKITKKYDKITHSDLRANYMDAEIKSAYPFMAATQRALRTHMEKVAHAFAAASGYANFDDALAELKKCLREEVVWERNTVWRDMIANERMVNAVGVQTPELEGPVDMEAGQLKPRHAHLTKTQKQLMRILSCTLVFFLAWAIPVFDGAEQQRCWAMLIYVSLLWATEALPLHVTALLVPFLTVVLGVLRSPASSHKPLGAGAASKEVFASMFSSVIMLLLGGFALAAALSKHDVARIIASWILSRAGTSPKTVLLANMFVATFASMWISNVAAPVLCFSLIKPILRTLPNGSSFVPCLIMGIAMASNVGGMASPISSPQNIIAIDTMKPSPSWFQWFAVSVPVCILCNLGIWMLLLLVYRPQDSTPAIHQTRFVPEKLNRRQIYVCVVTVLTILLWCFESSLAALFGDMGIVAVVPLVLLFAFPKVLGKEDFNNFLWTVVVLAMGGIALGHAVDSSGLLHELAGSIEGLVDGFPVFAVLCVFCGLILVCCTFVSHTVGSLIILPIVAEVGSRLPEPHGRLLVMGTALMASGAMGLPVSGFPNMNAIMLEDTLGNPYLSTMDFFKAGVPSSIIAYFVIITAGYFVMSLLGF